MKETGSRGKIWRNEGLNGGWRSEGRTQGKGRRGGDRGVRWRGRIRRWQTEGDGSEEDFTRKVEVQNGKKRGKGTKNGGRKG